ncbi:Dam family site-specific DNA-(adenine-N6)-methyltransferase [Patescibacteria group bacterium]|nr:Dam family site-specific DNA-(adenine-N6)-methyltransferase [Patescibacteria group bacterium]
MFNDNKIEEGFIKSPLNYIGGKYKLLKQIIPYFPKNIDTFVDLFAGGCNVGINVRAKRYFFNDNLTYLIDMYKEFQNTDIKDILKHIQKRVNEYQLSLTNSEGYNQLRAYYNTNRNSLDLFVLIAYSFNHQIRFNNSHEFNNPFGKERSTFNPSMKKNLERFIHKIQNIETIFTNYNFDKFPIDNLSKNDFVYCDPPYLITTGSYNDGKRGFTGWSMKEEKKLLEILDELNAKGVKFALSNVIEHKGKSNIILQNWVNKNSLYKVNSLYSNYSNSNYHTKDRSKNGSKEILITNYENI